MLGRFCVPVLCYTMPDRNLTSYLPVKLTGTPDKPHFFPLGQAMSGCTHEHVHTNAHTCIHTYADTHLCVDGRRGRQTERRTDGGRDGQTEGETDRQTEGETDRRREGETVRRMDNNN